MSIVIDYYYDEGGKVDAFCYLDDVRDRTRELED